MNRFILVLFLGAITACGANNSTDANSVAPEDSSVSGAVAASVGGALSSSSSSGAISFTGGGSCPTFTTTAGAQCSSTGGTMWLDYGDCSFANSAANWHGFRALTMSAGTATCGTFPNPGNNGTLHRQFVTALASTTPGSIAITSRYATIGVIDDHSINLTNFNGDSLISLIHGGFGDEVTFGAAGERTSVTIAHRIYVLGSYDHTIYGNLTVHELTAGAISRTITGQITTYHNKLQVIGTTTFNNVVHSDTCCLPIGGTVTTLFSQGTTAPTTEGLKAVGKTETLTFTGVCGTATLESFDGTTQSVALSRCY